jgi:hypothetical protein
LKFEPESLFDDIVQPLNRAPRSRTGHAQLERADILSIVGRFLIDQVANYEIELFQIPSGQGFVSRAGDYDAMPEFAQLVCQPGPNVIAVLNDENVASILIALDHQVASSAEESLAEGPSLTSNTKRTLIALQNISEEGVK